MRTTHYAALDGGLQSNSDEPSCPHCAELLAPGGVADQLVRQPSGAWQHVGELFTGDTAPALRAVVVSWFAATVAIAVLAFLPG
ncbi:hypothetical protein J7E96_35810 [Streptomyces sp. ISL-96]|uniref:hypothetical protein n=1 Tax=Streptomyces sp. ISL-96 TaxID=2819191 RepID=UPI001BE69378|nr:hypothetical protein [Streptomyces sp. ISL-96]MBT2493769.1 hypothetical protein [Streptomyces sp. ISL-96]